MELREGYKLTKVGIIPEDWEVKYLGEIMKLKNGYAFSSVFFSNTGAIIITPGNFKLDGGLYFTEKNTLRYSGSISQEMIFQNGDLVIVMTDLTPDCNLLGKPGIVNTKEVVLHNQRIGKISLLNNSIDKNYLYWFFASEIFSKRMKETATGSTVRHTSVKSINNSLITLPLTIAEQTAIATALSDTDALISRLENLIAKKRNIKQGAMQKLLQPKEGWEVKKLGEVAPLQRGFDLPNRYLEKGAYPVVYSNGVLNYHSKYQALSPGVITGRSGTIGKVTFIEENYWPHNTTLWVTDFRGNHPKFIYFLFLRIKLDQFATGSGVPTLNRNDVHNFYVSIPDTEEQIRIALILSNMDKEINALETKLEKYKRIKAGMMQNLLTGKIRLI